MARVKTVLAQIAYGSLFSIIIPVALWLWSRVLEQRINLPQVHNLPLGAVLVSAGLALILVGMSALRVVGGGLPMNAFPPPRFVSSGIYAYIPHPIYGGFAISTIGISIAVGSAAGLWFISPAVIIGCAALVLGYELPDLKRRFGSRVQSTTTLAPDVERVPTRRERFSVFVLVLLPWIVLYEAVVWLGVPHDAAAAGFSFERRIPVLQWTEIFYASTYFLVVACPLIAARARDLRRFTIHGWFAMSLVFPLFFTIPLISPPRAFEPTGWLGTLLNWERGLDTPAAAFPSFHVIWAILTAEMFISRWHRLRWIFSLWATAIALSCITTGMHALVDVMAGAVVGVLSLRSKALWETVRRHTERTANSWREWHVGRVRIINHGAYVALAVWVGTVIIGVLLGSAQNLPVIALTIAGIIGAGLWAQFVEGSSGLLRPYGFYGGVIGIMVTALFTKDPLLILTAFAVAAPVIQALGRFRCLVQGCCHGAPTSGWLGIRYFQPQSRVCKANLKSIPVHATQLYSILWNIPCFLLLVRLWVAQAPLTAISGTFLILNGAGRFVEEAYRGEPQTKIFYGLRLYQWIAIASVLVGGVITTLPSTEYPPTAEWNPSIVGLGIITGIITWAAMGLDLPNSNRRFARLT